MEDTTRGNRQLVRDIIMSKTIEERFLICAALYEDAKEFARIGMPAGLSDEDEKLYVFKKLHGAHPFDLAQKQASTK